MVSVSTAPTVGRNISVAIVYGTRPEAIKMAPLVRAVNAAPGMSATVIVSGQHRHMLAQVHEAFGITPCHDLNLFEPGQRISDIVARTLTGLTPVLEAQQPDMIVVHGDTSTAFAAASAGFFLRVPVVHLEAGLRTYNLDSPFPEEANRQLITRLSRLHLAPTALNRAVLLAEGVDPADVVVTGNTVIDALADVAAVRAPSCPPADRYRVLVTLHRRENLGPRMQGVARAIARFAAARPHVSVRVPLHLNPQVRSVVVPELQSLPNVAILEPLGYLDFVDELLQCGFVLTDSGGIQEEAPGLGKPVLVARDTTERPEAVEAGTARLVGTGEADVHAALAELADDDEAYERMANAVNPYGDGRAAQRAQAALAHLAGVGHRIPDFEPLVASGAAV